MKPDVKFNLVKNEYIQLKYQDIQCFVKRRNNQGQYIVPFRPITDTYSFRPYIVTIQTNTLTLVVITWQLNGKCASSLRRRYHSHRQIFYVTESFLF